MKRLLLVRAAGLSVEQAVRGDVAWNVSDLIAEGSLVSLSGRPDVEGAIRGLGGRVTVVDVPYTDGPSFDDALGRLRREASGALVAILSEGVFISQHAFPEIRPGTAVAAADLPRLLEAMVA
jgi:hypothetical protein